ncbi:unnamed protein product [Urochloa decumbens]|uniref:PGG domain-containing protein n=1 Tax=Urochloa decumbens TaxID=240449 RepID=A0ABC9G417_9POAL
MAPAGIISPVPGAGGRAALFAAARWVSPRPSTASLGSATAGVSSRLRPPKGGIVAAAPGVRGRGALLARRSGPLHSAMGTAPRLEVAAGGFGARLFATSSSGPLLFAAAAAPRASALRHGARLLPSAGKSEGTQAQEEGEGTPVPTSWKRLMSRFKEAGAKVLEEAKKSAFAVFLLFLALCIGTLASANNIPGSSCAATIVVICEKGEKFHKFVSHFVPYILIFINHFFGK